MIGFTIEGEIESIHYSDNSDWTEPDAQQTDLRTILWRRIAIGAGRWLDYIWDDTVESTRIEPFLAENSVILV